MDHLLIAILVGIVAGFLASHVVSGHGYGLLGDLVIGILGALVGTFMLGTLIGAYVLAPLGLPADSVLAQIFVAFIGAVVVLAIMRILLVGGARRHRRVF